MTKHQPTTKNTNTSGDYPQTTAQLFRAIALISAVSFGGFSVPVTIIGIFGDEYTVGVIGAFAFCLAIVSCSVYIVSGPMNERKTEPEPVTVSELGLTPQDFVLLQLACIEHANRLIADADTEDDDFGPDGDLALQFRADATRLLAMHHEFTERADAGAEPVR